MASASATAWPTAQARTRIAGWAAVWQERVGAAALVDTYLMEGTGWRPLTAPTEWPIRRAVSQGRSFDLADLLVR